MNNISFDNVYLLLIAVPLIILCAVPFAVSVRKSNRNVHNITSMALHIIMAVLIAFAAAGTYISTVVTETNVYVVADVSYSTHNKLDTIDSYIRNLDLPDNTKLGLICFGKDYELVSELGSPQNVASVKEATVDDTETNAAAALTYAGTLFRQDVIKRIVLITDGTQTDLSADNSIRHAVEGLDKSIQVDAIFIDSNPDSADYREVQISGVQATENAYLDSEQIANITIQSSYVTNATLSLKRNGEIIEDGKQVLLTLGTNIVEVELYTAEAGIYDYEVTVSADGDASDKNNVYYFTQTVTDEIKMLVISQNWSDCAAVIERYGTKGVIDVYEHDENTNEATRQAFLYQYRNNPNISVRHTLTIPYDIEDLCKYDEIVLANADISQFGNYFAFITNLKDAVYTFGKSLITMGNLYIQNRDFGDDLADWDLYQTYAGMLPVKYGNNGDDPKLYTFVIDTSRSMGHLYHMDIMKDLTVRLLDMLEETDYVSIFTFDGEVTAYYNAKSLRDKDEIKETIQNLDIANGTVIGSGLRQAFRQISNLSYSEKQVMLITDGITFGADPEDPEVVVGEMAAAEIVTSVFDVGRQGDNGKPGSNVNDQLKKAYEDLVKLAEIGGGNYYYSNNAEYLDEDILGQVADDLTEAVIEEETSVNVEIPRDDIFDNIDLRTTEFSTVSGYVYSGLKPSATTVLTVNHMRSTGFKVEKPLYAYWTYGTGKVTTFTSSIGNWTKNWTGTVKNTFFNNVFNVNVPEEKNANPYALEIQRDGSSTTVNVKLPSTLLLNTSARIVVTLPDGSTISETMQGTGSSYYYTFNASDLGKYTIDVTYTCNDVDYDAQKFIYNCYLSEYDAFSIFDSSELHKALDDKDGATVSEDGKLKLVNDDDLLDKYIVTFTVPLLIAAVVLFVIDIIVRKLTLNDIRSFFGFGGGRKKEVKK